ncbi:MAG: hypothetical protein M1830_007872 [Pleopsidium flavum]|nr:MAG: hypothetical protein M1830_007872 [Pleopsidium flavum]
MSTSQVACPPKSTDLDATAPRKRRRRAPATGAADDCFACLDRKSKCDRCRPYCTQCLDRGKDCSGYKTTLTWGVGVASRGKLRGLTLPIVQKAAPPANHQPHRARSSIGSAPGARSSTQSCQNSLEGQAQPRTSAGSPRKIPPTYDFVSAGPTIPSVLSIPSAHQTWPIPSFHSPWGASQKHKPGLRRQSLRPLNVPLASSYNDFGLSKSAPFFGDYGFHGYTSPVEYPHTPDDFVFSAGALPIYKDFLPDQGVAITQNGSLAFEGHGPNDWPCGSMTSSLSSDHSSHDFAIDDLQQGEEMGVSDTVAGILDDTVDLNARNTENVEEVTQTSNSTPRPSIKNSVSTTFSINDTSSRIALKLSRSLPSLSIGSTPRLQYLIDYYDVAIAPVIVAFDGPTNPYRTHILRLAVESETLQHAIAALSASNLRTREYNNALLANRKAPIQIGHASMDLKQESSIPDYSLVDHKGAGLSNKTPSLEELHHKRASVQSLNAQLADPLRRNDDSILATLLILCLYHICDTGVAKFRTQFEGVKMILGMRGRHTSSNAKETNWLTTMFTWFDAMTATVNDREGQLQGPHLDLATFAGDDWALENLAGCDGRLFKTIAKLGRLNLLSQGKQVDNGDIPRPQPLPTPRAASISRQDYYSMNHNRFDGNGWATLLEEEDQDNSQAQFRKEWSQIRAELQDWELDPPHISPSSTTLHIDRVDLSHISESFRYSALIYTERLAYPHLPSPHPNFQNLVAQALYHITSVKSDVFLLWPLFITGTECVNEHHMSIIRQRCLHIQKDSGFFNNISVLELLEKIWRDRRNGEGIKTEFDGTCSAESMVGGQKFSWRKAMERPDGEYIVI